MNRTRYTAIRHRGLPFCNPLNEAKITQTIEMLALRPDEHAIDFGAGTGEFLVRTVERWGISATAVELEGSLISELPRRSEGRIAPRKISVRLSDAKPIAHECADSPFDVGICIGSTHAFGGYAETLDALQKAVKPLGLILIGDLYWKKSPAPEFLDFLGMQKEDLGTQESLILQAETKGLVPLWGCIASDDDFDAYEWRTHKAMEDFFHEHPEDPDRQKMLDRSRIWRRVTMEWARDSWGFGLYLFRNGG